PKSREETYKSCPPWGRGGDPLVSLLKNRIDRPDHPHHFTAGQFLALHWPGAISQRSLPMEFWTREERRKVYRYEGMAATLTGYAVSFAPHGPPEETNCMG